MAISHLQADSRSGRSSRAAAVRDGARDVPLSRSTALGGLLIATTVAGVGLPHVIVGEIAGSWPAWMIGVLAGLACLGVTFAARDRGGRALGVIGIAVAALAPLIAFVAQEGAERQSGLETAHAEPSLIAAILTQAPLVVVALLAVRLLVAIVRTAVRVWGHRPESSPTRRPRPTATPTSGALFPSQPAMRLSNGQRAPPPFSRASHRTTPLG